MRPSAARHVGPHLCVTGRAANCCGNVRDAHGASPSSPERIRCMWRASGNTPSEHGMLPAVRRRSTTACGDLVPPFDLCSHGSRNLATSARLRMRQVPAHALFERGAGRHDMPAMPDRVHGSGSIWENALSIANRSVLREPHCATHGLVEAGQNPRRRVAFGDGAADHSASDGM